jgi:hypothetical protein
VTNAGARRDAKRDTRTLLLIVDDLSCLAMLASRHGEESAIRGRVLDQNNGTGGGCAFDCSIGGRNAGRGAENGKRDGQKSGTDGRVRFLTRRPGSTLGVDS